MQPDILVKEEFKTPTDSLTKEEYVVDNSNSTIKQNNIVTPKQISPISSINNPNQNRINQPQNTNISQPSNVNNQNMPGKYITSFPSTGSNPGMTQTIQNQVINKETNNS